MKTIKWIGEDDGYGIVGYSFVCPQCKYFNRFHITEDPTVQCENCGLESKNPGDPE